MDNACLIKVDGTVISVSPKNGTDFSLEELQGFVGGNVEIIDIGNNQIMCIDEEGKYKEKYINDLATFYAMGHVFGGDVIVGDALICMSFMVK